jgi:two-component SAPR family response regulator
MSSTTRFVIIDDDVLNNKICTVTLKKIFHDADINTFLDSVAGFEYVASEFSKKDHQDDLVLFLDLTMPAMDGWEFLEKFDQLGEDVKKRVKIYVLSSSDYKKDIDKARANKYVLHYLIKPFTKKTIRLITVSLGKEYNEVEG